MTYPSHLAASAASCRLASAMATAFEAAELGAEGFSSRRQAGGGPMAAPSRDASALAPLLRLLELFARVEQLVVAGAEAPPCTYCSEAYRLLH